MNRSHRWLAAGLALLGWFALAVQWRLSVTSSGAFWAGTWLLLGFFTVLTNTLVALSLTSLALEPRAATLRFFRHPGVIAALAMSIIVVALIYNALLRQLWHPQGWQLFADIVMHDVMPAAYVIYWWIAVPKDSLRWKHVCAWQAYPIAYFLYAMARGAADGWYPYPFLDVGALGYGWVVVNALGALAAFVLVGLALLGAAAWQGRHHRLAGARQPMSPD